MTTVAVRLKGGLGNQLFQWALARELGLRGARVLLESRVVKRVELGGALAGMRVSRWPSLGLSTARGLAGSWSATGYRHFSESSFSFTPVPLRRGRWLLDGYWQSPRYFPSVAESIRHEIRAWAASTLSEVGRSVLAEMHGRPSASVHIRRGDYTANPAVAQFHGVLPDSYFRSAVSSLIEAGAQRVYLFSDELSVALPLLDGLPGVVPVPEEAATHPVGEIYLMSECAGHVLSNSSFSWWGAWLGDATARTIVPDRWFMDRSIDTSDLLPGQWTRLHVSR